MKLRILALQRKKEVMFPLVVATHDFPSDKRVPKDHFGNVYCDNLAGVRDDIAGLSLNELYLNKAAAAVSVVDSTESS